MSPHHAAWLLDEKITFLNHGSFGACPQTVLVEQSRLRERMEREPLLFLWREIEEELDNAREQLALFLRADPLELAFVTNATSAVNAVIRSLDLIPGDELVTTNHAYNACHNVLKECTRRAKAKVVVAQVPFPITSPQQVIKAVMDAVTPRTKLVLLDHVTSPTALIFPVEELTALLEERGIDVMIDGAHAPGMLPLDFKHFRPAYYTGNLHKWVCAPKGSAFLHVRKDRQRGIQPAVISHGYNTPRAGRTPFHDAFDWQGTQDVTAWLAVPAALRFCERLLPGGWPALMDTNRSLAVAARQFLSERLSLEPPCPESMLGAMATLPLPANLEELPAPLPRSVDSRFDPLQTRLFERFRIEVPVIKFGQPARRWFRVCAQAYNTPDDYTRLSDALIKAGKSPE
jgi:isopenicillin-N epimerase